MFPCSSFILNGSRSTLVRKLPVQGHLLYIAEAMRPCLKRERGKGREEERREERESQTVLLQPANPGVIMFLHLCGGSRSLGSQSARRPPLRASWLCSSYLEYHQVCTFPASTQRCSLWETLLTFPRDFAVLPIQELGLSVCLYYSLTLSETLHTTWTDFC